MTNAEFLEQVQKHFKFLADDYGFAVSALEALQESRIPRVRYVSDKVGMELVLDRGEVSLWVGPLGSLENWLDLAQLIPFLYPEGLGEPVYVYPETWEEYSGPVDWQLARLAKVAYCYLGRVLRGEFTAWKEVTEYWLKAGDAWYGDFLERKRRGQSMPSAIPSRRDAGD